MFAEFAETFLTIGRLAGRHVGSGCCITCSIGDVHDLVGLGFAQLLLEARGEFLVSHLGRWYCIGLRMVTHRGVDIGGIVKDLHVLDRLRMY